MRALAGGQRTHNREGEKIECAVQIGIGFLWLQPLHPWLTPHEPPSRVPARSEEHTGSSWIPWWLAGIL